MGLVCRIGTPSPPADTVQQKHFGARAVYSSEPDCNVLTQTRMQASRVFSKGDLLALLRRHGERITALGVLRLGLFGSFARNAASPESDVDLLVEFAPGRRTFDTFMELARLLEEILDRRVELVTREALSPYLGPRILEEVEDVPLVP